MAQPDAWYPNHSHRLTSTIAFVTKSYAPDFERCRLLSRSIALLAPGARHWIIVDARDRKRFGPLESTTTQVITTEELLPKRLRKLALGPLGKNVWLGLGIRPTRGWVVQQLAKLAIGQVATEDVLIHADSDVVLIRPFREASLTDAVGSVRLYRVPDAIGEDLPTHIRWHRTAEQVLGLPPRPLPLPDYIGGLIPWERRRAISLLERIEAVSGQHWLSTLAGTPHLSEYILYGRFAEDDPSRPREQLGSSISLCRCYWGSEPLTNDELRRFIDEAQPDEVGIMVSAKAGMNPTDYEEVFEERWTVATTSADRASTGDTSDS